MPIYKNIIFPIIRRTDAEFAHNQTARMMGMIQYTSPGQRILRRIAGKIELRPVDLFGLTFPNVLGVAAGLDKDVRMSAAIGMLGFGHVEVGTLTPKPQPGNPRPRIYRLIEDRAIINRMGFPNEGVERVLPRLRRLSREPRRSLIGVSLGKQKETPLEEAAGDYLTVMRRVYPYCDYLAVNISSPNTPGLRELQGGRYLESLLDELVQETELLARKHETIRRPLLVKIAPDLNDTELEETIGIIASRGADGVIASNTSLSRPELNSMHRKESGGLSGHPITAHSTEVIARISKLTGGRLPIIGAGGVFTAADVRAKLDAGASLVQVYTGFVYEGPSMAGRILRQLDRA